MPSCVLYGRSSVEKEKGFVDLRQVAVDTRKPVAPQLDKPSCNSLDPR